MLASLSYFFISTITQTFYIYLETTFLPLETVFRTHHFLDLSKEPVSNLRKEQLLPRKVIYTFSLKVARDLKVLSKRRI